MRYHKLVSEGRRVSQSFGFYPVARHLYHHFSPKIRRDRQSRQRLYAEFVSPGSLCFDIGANVGQSIEIMLACGADLVALEPNPACYPTLKWAYGNNNHVEVLFQGAGAKPGELELYVSGTDSRASIREDWNSTINETVKVSVTTLDQLIKNFGPPDFCKVDVEGYELEVFRGLSQPIKAISFEILGKRFDLADPVIDRLLVLDPKAEGRLANSHQTEWLWKAWRPLDDCRRMLREKRPHLSNMFVRSPSAGLV